MKLRLKYISEDMDRHGNVRLYFRYPGRRKVRLPNQVGTPDFLRAYREAFAAAQEGKEQAAPEVTGKTAIIPSSIRALCVQYFKSAMYNELDARTRKVRRSILERFCDHKNDGDKPFAMLLPRHIRQRCDEMMDRPEAANGMVKAVRQLFKFAVRYDHHHQNPAAEVEYLKGNPDGFHSWSLDEIEAFEEQLPVGTTARVALALALYTGQRRADLVQFGPQHVRDGWLVFTQHKDRNRKPVRLEIPIIAELQRIIDATKTGEATFLVSERGRPFTGDGFGNSFREPSRKAGLADCSIHGLRKAAAARLAELGCKEHEIMFITGDATSKEVTRYTRAARQKTRAESALRRMEADKTQDNIVPL